MTRLKARQVGQYDFAVTTFNALTNGWLARTLMDPELRAKVRHWKAAMDADNELVLEEKRSRTPAEQMSLLQAFFQDMDRL